jgi:glucose/arabinose dehydrogenase
MRVPRLRRKALEVSLIVALLGGVASQALLAASPTIETVARGLETPWAIDITPDGHAFVTERAGSVRVIDNGKLLADPWITIDVAAVSEAGCATLLKVRAKRSIY